MLIEISDILTLESPDSNSILNRELQKLDRNNDGKISKEDFSNSNSRREAMWKAVALAIQKSKLYGEETDWRGWVTKFRLSDEIARELNLKTDAGLLCPDPDRRKATLYEGDMGGFTVPGLVRSGYWGLITALPNNKDLIVLHNRYKWIGEQPENPLISLFLYSFLIPPTLPIFALAYFGLNTQNQTTTISATETPGETKLNYASMEARTPVLNNGTHTPHALRIRGYFDTIDIGNVPKNRFSDRDTKKTLRNIKGTLLGLKIPNYLKDFNPQMGLTLVFISEDGEQVGYVYDFNAPQLKIDYNRLCYVHQYLPGGDGSGNPSEESPVVFPSNSDEDSEDDPTSPLNRLKFSPEQR